MRFYEKETLLGANKYIQIDFPFFKNKLESIKNAYLWISYSN